MADVNMPKLSDTMEEGTVLEWKKQDGEEVHRGEVLAEIESDKASFEIEAEGVLHIAVDKGLAVPVGQLIGRIGGEAPAQAEAPAAVAAAPAAPAAAPAPVRATPPPQPSPASGEGPAGEGARRGAAVNGAERVKASP